MKITKAQLRKIIRESLNETDRDAMMDLEARERAGDLKDQDLSSPIPIDDLVFRDDQNGQMMFPGPGYSYSVSPEAFEQEKEKLKAKYGKDAMISVPNPSYPSSRKIHSTKFDKIQSRENQNFMRHQKMLKKRLGRDPGLGT